MPNLTPDSIYYADGTTPASLADITSAMATSVQNAFNKRQLHNFVWANETEREAEASPDAGDIGYQQDVDAFYIYSGAAWVIWAKQPTTYTPTFTNFAASSSAFVYAISSGIVTVQGKFVITTPLPSGALTITTPTDYNIDTTQLGTVTAAQIGSGGVDGTTDHNLGVRVASSSSVALTATSYNGALAGTGYTQIVATSGSIPLSWASGNTAYVQFSYPAV